MRKIKYFVLKVLISILKIIYFFMKLFKTKKRITFLSRQSDNITLDISLLKDELNVSMSDYEVVVLTKKLPKDSSLINKIKYGMHMFKQMYFIATSKVAITDSYCIVLSLLNHKKDLLVIQMWHAIGSMKKFGYALIDKEKGYSKEIAKIMRMHKNYDYIFISSFGFIKDYIEGFNTTRDKVVELPLPKVDIYLDEEYKKNTRDKLYKRIPSLKNKKNILYCSTFRKNQKSDYNIRNLIEEIDFDKYNLLYKPHPLNTIKSNDKRIITDFETTQEALFVADYVICDYSSVIYEVGLLHLLLYIYAYDWESYKSERELNLDFSKVPLFFSTDAKSIIDEIKKDNFNDEEFQKFMKKNVALPNTTCTKAIVEFIKTHLK